MATEGVEAAEIIADGISAIIAGGDVPFVEYAVTLTDPDSPLTVTATLPLTYVEVAPGLAFGPRLSLTFGQGTDGPRVEASLGSDGFMIGSLVTNRDRLSDMDLTITEA